MNKFSYFNSGNENIFQNMYMLSKLLGFLKNRLDDRFKSILNDYHSLSKGGDQSSRLAKIIQDSSRFVKLV